jgi:DNA-binding NarL/FixJ family response regulator
MNQSKTKTVLIVDDQRLFVNGIRHVIESVSNTEIVGELYEAKDVIPFLMIHNPDYILLDLNLPGLNGIELLPEIRKINQTSYISILTMYADYDIARKCNLLGANAYLTKDSDAEELSFVFTKHITSEFYYSKNVDKPDKIRKIKEDNFDKVALITPREKEIILLLAKGYHLERIADTLFISVATVQTHRKNIFKKLKFKKVSELVAIAYQYEII